MAAICRSIEELRGGEGTTSARYFALWASFLHDAFLFVHRSRRPALNPVNACISFGSTLLYNEMAAFLHAHGLNPAPGLLHATENGRWSLALDLMEPFRPDRAHRFGQKSTVFVHKLICEGTIEERILQLQQRKAALIAGLMDGSGTTTLADKAAVPAPNLLKAHPAPAVPNCAWVTDITCIPTGEGWLYLAPEMDLCSRRIIGWDAGPGLTTDLTVRALRRALTARPGCDLRTLLYHSDRGCQYTSHAFRRKLASRGITQSMSRAGNCYDKAAIESFRATLKAECFAHHIPATRAQARAKIFDYIETFYNPVRKHSALGYLSPVNFEQSLLNN